MTRPPLLLIHGALGSGPQLAALHDRLPSDRVAHLIELEGHGRTPAVDDAFSIARFAQNVRDAMTARRVKRADLFGYSLGGYVALSLAAESPDLVASVMTLGTKLAWTPDVAAREVGRLDPATIRAKVPAFADALERRHGSAGGWERVLTRTAALLTALGAHPVVDSATVSRIQQPVRLMVGDRDALVTIEETRAVAQSLSHGELAVLPDTPHPIEQVRIPLVAELVRDFYRDRPAR